MGRKKIEKPEEKKTGKTMEEIMEAASDHKISFAKVAWGVGRGPYIVAFPDTCTRNYCEMNAHEFKAIHAKDVKTDTLPLWECGARTPEKINHLPKINVKDALKKAEKIKQDKKAAKS
jgi:hypothetical protein